MFFRPGATLRVNRAMQRALDRGSSRSTANAIRRIHNQKVVLESLVRPALVAATPMLVEAAGYMVDVRSMFTSFEEDDDGT
ncbi:hypothetical protein SDRG_07207 [Saprolegnia diclina VS20]|uniref:Uncharacterized protein n=2 Tax=Saprolegnia TaxID=4769 RepID=A0A067CE33_SAPPC|nr:hypothetical protein SDRG_07207 [Saprolegnia diclina VS20]XP_012204534.1 hypothetical protein SPRG_20832 [Saprolegnia parasitica CBS 223.65]EQC35499.1 hypothetical protein SDRG_07207 [Saprolegnia diclina VS20]KDO24801.1 hypothetical protein SPRG_20832 [Saprolegnia parasitica CBS 223.65]|eukprot:XP_008611249.1 hypothetical protein SDRG_07207 [Saprolegnia diclina VS20]